MNKFRKLIFTLFFSDVSWVTISHLMMISDLHCQEYSRVRYLMWHFSIRFSSLILTYADSSSVLYEKKWVGLRTLKWKKKKHYNEISYCDFLLVHVSSWPCERFYSCMIMYHSDFSKMFCNKKWEVKMDQCRFTKGNILIVIWGLVEDGGIFQNDF